MYTILDNIFTTYTIQLNSMRLQKEAPKEKPPFAEKYGWVWNDDNHHWMSSDTQEKVTESLPKEHQAEIGNEYIIGSKARNKKFRGAHAKITEFAEEGRRAKVQIGEESGWMNVDYLEQMINNGGLEQPKEEVKSESIPKEEKKPVKDSSKQVDKKPVSQKPKWITDKNTNIMSAKVGDHTITLEIDNYEYPEGKPTQISVIARLKDKNGKPIDVKRRKY